MTRFTLLPANPLILLVHALLVLMVAAAAGAQPTFTKAFTPSTIGPGSVSTVTFTITNGSSSPVTGLAFTDILPAAVTIADPTVASTTCDLTDGGTLTAPDGGSTITLSDARLAGSQICTVTVDVTASTPGTYTNPTITLSSSAGIIMSDAVDLTVDAQRPGFSKSFAPSSVPFGGRSTLTFTIDNSANSSALFFLSFTDNLPAGLAIADPSNASTSCGGTSSTMTATPGAGVVFFRALGAQFPAGSEVLLAAATCTVTVDVVAASSGQLVNSSEDLSSASSGASRSSGKANAALDVTVGALLFVKSFLGDPVNPGATVDLEFTIINTDRDDDATGVAFTDSLETTLTGLAPSGALPADPCGGGSTLGFAGGVLSLAGGTVGANSSCTFTVTLLVPGTSVAGAYPNTSSPISATIGAMPFVGDAALDTLIVNDAPFLTKTFLDNPVAAGDIVTVEFMITNTSSTSAATDIAFSDNLGGFLSGVTVTSLPAGGFCGPGSDIATAIVSEQLNLFVFGGNLAASDSCTFTVDLQVPADTAAAPHVNTTSAVSGTVDGTTQTGQPASDTLTVVSGPVLTKEFTDDPALPGGAVTLEFTITHGVDATADATGIAFTDDLTATLSGLKALGLPITPVCNGGTLGGTSTLLSFTGGSLVPGGTCTFSVTLQVPDGAPPGVHRNTTSNVTATVAGLAVTNDPAQDDLIVAGLDLVKSFTDDPVIPGDTVTLEFTLDNTTSAVDATNIAFTDNLGAVLSGLTVVAPALPAMECGGTLSLVGSILSLSGASVVGGSFCTFSITLQVPAAAAEGAYGNVTSNVSADIDGSPAVLPSAADILVVDSNLLALAKSFTDDPVAPGDSVTLEFTLTNLDAGRAASSIDFTDDLGAALSGLTFDSELLNDCDATISGTGSDMITVTGAALAAGGSCTLRLSLTVPAAAAADVYTNTTGSVTGTIGGFAVSGDAASDDLEVVQLLAFSKSFDGPTAATRTATLTFTITNPGTDTATGISFTDDLDNVIPGMTATSLPAFPCGAGSSITGTSFLTFMGGELPPMGGTCSFGIDVKVPDTAGAGTFPNTTSGLFQNGVNVADPATADLVVEPPPTFAKVFMPDTILAGGVSTLRFTVNNTASSLAADNLAFTDNLPAGVVVATPSVTSSTCGGILDAMAGASKITLTGGSVGAGATCTIDVNVTSIVSGIYVNTTGGLASTSGLSDAATNTLTVNPAADLSVTKSDSVTSATPGGSVTYAIVVANAGPSPDPSVTLSDTFPSPPLTCTWTSVAAGGATGNTAAGSGDLAETLSLPAGSSVTYTATCAIDSGATGTLSNTASITPSITDTVPGNNSATDGDTVLVPSADLAITKSDGVTSAVPGQTVLTYTIVASNGGLSDDPAVSVTDTFPADLTCTYTSVAAGGATGNTAAGSGDLAETLSLPTGGSVTYTVTCSIDAAATGTLSNTATISGSVNDPNTGNNSATDGDTVLGPQADLAVTKTDGVTSAVPGQTTLTYMIVVSNAGPSDDPAAALADVFPPDLSCTYTSLAAGGATGNTAAGSGDLAETLSLPVGGSVSYMVDCAVGSAATGTLSNTATITASVTDPAPGNDSATDGDTVLSPEADLSVTKTDSVDPVNAGADLTYTITVTNAGPSDAQDVVATDTLPAGVTLVATNGCAEDPAGVATCSLGTIAQGTSKQYTVTVTVDTSASGDLTNEVSVASSATEANPGDESASETTTVVNGTPPEVTDVSTAAGPLDACDTLRQPISTLHVTIEDDLGPILHADEISSYLLVGSGPDGEFSTVACGAAAGDDVPIEIVSLSLVSVDPTRIDVDLGSGGVQGGGLYRFFVCDSITDAAGNALDGDGDTSPGGDFEVSFFRADPLNLFENGHFDDCPVSLAPWISVVTAPNTITPGAAGADDVEGSPLSASAHISHSVDEPSSIGQCVPIASGPVHHLRARLRFDAGSGVLASFIATCEHFDAAACTGTSLGATSTVALVEDEGGNWVSVASEIASPAGSHSALCDFAVQAVGPDPAFDLYLDSLFLGLDAAIFADGFESGDTTAWSSAVP